MNKRWVLCTTLIVLCAAAGAQAALTKVSLLNIQPLAPANVNGWSGGALTFVPGGSDSIQEDTLIISWDAKDTVDTSKYNHIFQRITIPASGTPSILATATIRHDFRFDGTTQYGSSSYSSELAFDPVSKKIVTTGASGRFVSFDLFSTSTAITSIGYSKANSDTGFGRSILISPTGEYQSLYTVGSPVSNLRKASISRTDMIGTVNVTKTDTAVGNFTGWYPSTTDSTSVVNGKNCEAGTAYGPDSALLVRNLKNPSNALESHLYLAGAALDAAAINAATDLGNAEALDSMLPGYYSAFGIGAKPSAGLAFIRFGYSNQPGSPSYNKVLVVSGLPAVPEPATLMLLAASGTVLLRRRR